MGFRVIQLREATSKEKAELKKAIETRNLKDYFATSTASSKEMDRSLEMPFPDMVTP